jgi:toxin YoeB
MKRKIKFEADAFDDFTQWPKEDRKLYIKIVDLIKDHRAIAFSGLG